VKIFNFKAILLAFLMFFRQLSYCDYNKNRIRASSKSKKSSRETI